MVDLPDGLSGQFPVQTLAEKFFAFLAAKISSMSRAVLHSSEGRTRRHGRWVRNAMDAAARETKRAGADGEAVWS
jgi:hypothetical protein